MKVLNSGLDEEALYQLWDIPRVQIWIGIDAIDYNVVKEEVGIA